MIGTTLSHFKITAKLGEGGMGEVYRADDTKLGREVAIKVLPEAVAEDPERLARFEREAKVLASLNHPNIAAIYSFESDVTRDRSGDPLATRDEVDAALGDHPTAAVHFLVMELVEGEDLRERLERGAIPYSRARPIALQIAEALEAAHEKGIIHRDLKPANIKLTPEGQVKILDFGLAKAFDPAVGSRPDLSLSPTLTAQMTQAGVLLGTAAYMSPEQARGEEVGKQSDIWAFGAVLFEMLSNRLAFPGGTVTDVMAAVVSQEPDWSLLPPEVPPHVEELLHLCLAKDARQRVHDIADARLMLTRPTAPETEARTKETRWGWRQSVPWGLAALLAVAAGYLAWSKGSQPTGEKTIQRFSINLPRDMHLVYNEQVVLSPDGTKLLLVVIEDGVRRLKLRRFEDPEIIPIPDTDGVRNPFFSPDGESIGFSRYEEKMYTMSLATRRAIPIVDTGWGGGSWGPDGTIVYTANYTSGLYRIPATGGESEELTLPDPEKGELGHFWPQHLPGGNSVIFTRFSVPLSRSSLGVLDLDTGETRILIEDGLWGRCVPTGFLTFVRNHTLMAVRIDLETLDLIGAPVAVVSDLIPDVGQGDVAASFSDTGALAYVPGTVMYPLRRLTWVDRQGRETSLGEARRYRNPRVSPDGTRIVLTIEGISWDLWALELERGTLSRLSHEPATQFGALWTPSGDEIVYTSDDPPYNIHRRSSDGSGNAEVLLTSPVDSHAFSVSPDGQTLLLGEHDHETDYDLWLLPLDGLSEPLVWLQTPFMENFASFSPDGRWVAYTSNETGDSQVFVVRYPEADRKLQVSLTGGSRPIWSRDGRELYFRDGPRIMATEVETGDRFSAGSPRELFRGGFQSSDNQWDYDVAPDGRFIMIKTPDEDWPREILVVLNWFQELENLVPAS